MWWNRKAKVHPNDGPRMDALRLRVEGLEDQVLKLQRSVTDLQMGQAALEQRLISFIRRGRKSGDDVPGSGENLGGHAPASALSEAMRQVMIRRGSYGVPAGVPNGDDGSRG